jgi:hypothetical protein
MFIYRRSNLNTTNMGFLYFWKTLIDIFFMLIVLLNHSELQGGDSLTNRSDFMCKILSYLIKYMASMSSWINMFICFERLFFLTFPSKYAYFMKNKFNLGLIISVMLASLALISLANLIHHNNQKFILNENQTIFSTKCIATRPALEIISIVTILIRNAIPLFAIIVMNWLILRKIWLNQRCLHVNCNTSNNRFSVERRFTTVVINLNIVYVIFYTPLTLVSVAHLVANQFGPASKNTGAIIETCSNFALNFSLLYHSLFFFIMLLVNPIFDREVHSTFCVRSVYERSSQAEQPSIINSMKTKISSCMKL